MNDITCLNCGHIFPLTMTYSDDKGIFAICPECGGSFDTNEEVELNDAQTERCDAVYESVMKMCRTLTGDEALEWDMAYLGEIADVAAGILAKAGHRVWFPSVVTEEDGGQHIEEYWEPELP